MDQTCCIWLSPVISNWFIVNPTSRFNRNSKDIFFTSFATAWMSLSDRLHLLVCFTQFSLLYRLKFSWKMQQPMSTSSPPKRNRGDFRLITERTRNKGIGRRNKCDDPRKERVTKNAFPKKSFVSAQYRGQVNILSMQVATCIVLARRVWLKGLATNPVRWGPM